MNGPSLAQNYATHTIQNSFTNLQITSVQQTFLRFWSSHHTTNSFYPLICSCHSPTPFKSLYRLKISYRSFYFQAPALWNALPTPSSLSFSFFSISFSSLAIFFSIPQAAENSPFSSFLSSLAYLLSTGLTPWNFDMACLSFIIHSISFILDPFICSTRFNFMFVIAIVCRNKLTGISWQWISCQLHDALKILLIYHHIFHFTFSHNSFHLLFGTCMLLFEWGKN